MAKRIFFDARYIRPVQDGIGRFSANLFAALAQRVPLTAIICDERQLERLPPGTLWVKIHKPTSILEPFTAFILNRLKPEVVFTPMQTLGSWGRRFKLILTVHDLIYFHFPVAPKHLNPLIRFGWRLFHLSYAPERFLLSGASAVATVSETTAREIRAKKLTDRPVGVIHNAPEQTAGSANRSAAPQKSLVYMGTFMPYKNVETLVRGVALLDGFELHLLSPIDDARKKEIEAVAQESSAQIVFHNGVTDTQYQELLATATALVSASKDEGFGIPLVEAMSQAVPVVVSDIEIFHEVAGDAGRYFNPDEPESFATAIQNLVKKPVAGKKLVARAELFDWQRSAKALLELIDSI